MFVFEMEVVGFVEGGKGVEGEGRIGYGMGPRTGRGVGEG